MRITGGIFRGQQIKAPKSNCRPTQDMVREALFSMLADRVNGASFLDLFAGSGAVGLDAASRGARLVCWVDSDRRTLGLLKENVERICGKGQNQESDPVVKFFGGDAIGFLKKGLESQQFDLIFADPPYDRDEKKGWLGKILDVLACGSMLAPGGVFVMEQSADEHFEENAGWVLIKDKKYGSTRLRFFMRKETGGCSK